MLFEDDQLLNQLVAEFPSFPQILSKFGINPNDLQVLGKTGSHGVAFTDGKVVVKITDDKSEATASAKIAGRSVPGVNNIHYVGKFAKETPYHDPEISKENVQYYIIIQDLLSTKLSKQEAQMANMVGDFLVTNKRWPLDINQAIKDIYQAAYMKTHQNFISPGNTTVLASLLKNVQSLYSHGVKYMDVSSGNVGKNEKGELVVFDLGVSETRPSSISTVA